ncbi:hydrolase Nlp/P60 [Ferroacidibacillus organovorans]|uniref:Hydrolase Nlp/P60 n=1 Tax=Ferroacidibacillus organovorans TaxID=1765683 RepID=A0A101XRK2_9BACL|nr:hydrolase Nlp/P60 [Ferroacidibacillus organovorans]
MGSAAANSSNYTAPAQTTTLSTLPTLPLGVHLDPNITPLAPIHATYEQKFQAVLTVAQDKLGTPYIWGHNEDRGQYGFDCSNFTEYVYHHALGYLMSTSSRVQATSVGDPVPIGDMQPGDLLIFNNGGHVGIYIGNGQMIQEGGGLGKVGYLRVSPGSYWYNHLTAVKRMF